MRLHSFAALLVLIALVAPGPTASAQQNFSVKYFGLTIHPFGDYSAEIQPYKLDKEAHFVANFGGWASYERFIWIHMLSARIKQGVFTDCSGGIMGVSHLGLQIRLLGNDRHRLSFGLGPTLIYRQDWNRFDVYEDKGFWYRARVGGQSIQYKVIPYGCEFEYDYRLSQKADLSVGFTPGFPFAMTWSFGLKYWLDKDFKTRVKLLKPPKPSIQRSGF